MNSSQFRNNQLKHLAFILKCAPEDITWVIENIDLCFYEYEVYKKEKDSGFVKTYSDGTPKKRTISPSSGKLKRLQVAIKKHILDRIEMPAHIQGGIKGKSNITNGKAHQGKKYRFTTDLQEFFPSITPSMVFDVFKEQLKSSYHQARWLTQLTTYKFKLPQGASTSPHLANLCFLPIDNTLLAFCKDHEITYTRYIDDLTFSSTKDFKEHTQTILKIIKQGFKINHRKTFYSATHNITGIEVRNNYIDAPLHIRDKAKNEITDPSANKPYSNYVNQIRKTNQKVNSNS